MSENESIKSSIRKQLTQNVRSKDEDSDVVVRHHRDTVEQFIQEFVTPVLENKENSENSPDFKMDRLGNYYKVFVEGKMYQGSFKDPFDPLNQDRNNLDKVVGYLENVSMEDYYSLSREFIQGCFVVISNWLRNRMMESRIEVYKTFPPEQWYTEIVKLETNQNPEDIPENIQKIMNRIKIYGALNF